MKILFFSDIHGIDINLNKIKDVIENNNFDKIVVLGDFYYAGPNYNEDYVISSRNVKSFLNQYQDKLIGLRGNCDSDVDIKASDFAIVEDIFLINDNGIDIYCTHGNKYSYNKKDNFKQHGVLIYGHEHIPYIRKLEGVTYVCVGSISLPRNQYGATYMIYNNKKFTIYNIDGKEIDYIDFKEVKV